MFKELKYLVILGNKNKFVGLQNYKYFVRVQETKILG